MDQGIVVDGKLTYFEAREEMIRSADEIPDPPAPEPEPPTPPQRCVVSMAAEILRDGQEIQKISVIRNLPDLFETQCEESLVQILPLVQETLRNETKNLDLHCEGTIAYRNVLVEKSTTGDFDVVAEILRGILSNLEDQADSLSAAAWLETLVEVVDHLSVEAVRNDVLSVAINQCCHHSVQRRVISTKLLERLATKLSPQEVKSDLVPSIQALCQDVNAVARSSMCQRLPIIAAALTLMDSAAFVLPCLIELCNDEDCQVRENALEAVGRCMISFDKATCREIVIPLLRKCTEYSLRMADSTLPVVAKNLGTWCYTLQDVMADQECNWFVTLFTRLAMLGQPDDDASPLMTRSDPEGFSLLSSNIDLDPYQTACRSWCAYNFPGIALIFGAKAFREHLMPVYAIYCRDCEENVKKSISAGFHEIVKIMKDDDVCLSGLIDCFVDLIKSSDCDTVSHLAPNFGFVLPVFYGACLNSKTDDNGNFVQNSSRVKLDRILSACNRLIRNHSNWRCHQSFLDQLSCLSTSLEEDELYTTFVPLLKEEILTARAIPCRLAAIRSLLKILKVTPTESRRLSVIDYFVQILCRHQSCHKRALYLDVCVEAMELFSRQFFKKHFLGNALKLCDDNVSNVRLKLCKLLPSFKTALILPKDEPLLAKFESVIKGLLTKNESQWHRQAVQMAAQELSRVETATADDESENQKLAYEQERFGTKAPPKEPSPPPVAVKPRRPSPQPTAKEPSPPRAVVKPKQPSPPPVVKIQEAEPVTKPKSEPEPETPAEPKRDPPPTIRTTERLRPTRLRVHRPRTAIVRPQPQITITERAPSPRPVDKDPILSPSKPSDRFKDRETKNEQNKEEKETKSRSSALKPPTPVSSSSSSRRRIGLSETTNKSSRYQMTTVSSVARSEANSNTLPRARNSKDSNANNPRSSHLSSSLDKKYMSAAKLQQQESKEKEANNNSNNNSDSKTSIPVATSNYRRSPATGSRLSENRRASETKRSPYSLVKVQSSSAIENRSSRSYTGSSRF